MKECSGTGHCKMCCFNTADFYVYLGATMDFQGLQNTVSMATLCRTRGREGGEVPLLPNTQNWMISSPFPRDYLNQELQVQCTAHRLIQACKQGLVSGTPFLWSFRKSCSDTSAKNAEMAALIFSSEELLPMCLFLRRWQPKSGKPQGNPGPS